MLKIISFILAALTALTPYFSVRPSSWKEEAPAAEETERRYAFDGEGNMVYADEADFIELPYTADECRAEAERLLMTPFTVASAVEPQEGELLWRYELVSEDIPFPVRVYSGYTAVSRAYPDGTEHVTLYAGMWCDYYGGMMAYKAEEAAALARKYGIAPEADGRTERVRVDSFETLGAVIEYLAAANDLYDFRMDEAHMGGLLRDVISRPALVPYVETEHGDADVLPLYYVVNHNRYPSEKEALLGALREAYIAVLDANGMTDPAVTAEVRETYCRPALTQLLINGEPVPVKECDGFTLDANVVFGYNWLTKSYTGDVRLCFPASDYDAPPSVLGDDRNFRYLVELLGGRYESKRDDSLLSDYYTASWELGGNEYGAGSMLSSFIPVMSAFSKNGAGLSIEHSYSKDMWGLEDGYSYDDFCLRITPDGLAALLGVTAVPDYEAGTLNLVTPEGYFDFSPAAEKEAEEWPERFRVAKILSENGLAVKANRYMIYAADGSLMEDAVTEDYTWAELTQVNESIVMVRVSGGNVNRTEFYDTDRKIISPVYHSAALLEYPYIVYSPVYSGRLVMANAETGEEGLLLENVLRGTDVLKSAKLSPDGAYVQVTYAAADENGTYKGIVTETCPLPRLP